MGGRREVVTRWGSGERIVRFLVGCGRLEAFEASGLAAAADAQIGRAVRRLEATARAALENGDLDGAYAAACDSCRMAAEGLLARQGLRATGGEGSHLAVEDAVSAQSLPRFPRSPSRRSGVPAYASRGAVLRPVGGADHQGGCGVGDREGGGGAVGR
jgi:hypothetical protein